MVGRKEPRTCGKDGWMIDTKLLNHPRILVTPRLASGLLH